MGGNKSKKQHRMTKRIICAPIRLLIKTRELYMKAMEDCAGRAICGGAVPMVHVSPWPASASSGGDEELRQLLRAASSRRGLEKKVHDRKKSKQEGMGPRSHSVAVGKIWRIDEDKPYSFDKEDEIHLLCPRNYGACALKRNLVNL